MPFNCLTFLFFFAKFTVIYYTEVRRLLNDKVISLMYNISRSFLLLGHANTCLKLGMRCTDVK